MRFLVVDDDQFANESLSITLELLGYEKIRLCVSGDEALALLKAENFPDVVMCDLDMPEMDGVELLRHISEFNYPGAVVLMSGADLQVLKACEQVGVEVGLNMLGGLQKPISQEALRLLLASATKIHKPLVTKSQVVTRPELEAAIKAQEIVAWFQPQIDVRTGKVVAVEALARWVHPLKGLISPAVFIPLAEEWGLIDGVFHAVAYNALAKIGELNSQGYAIRLSLNVSVDNLSDASFPVWLKQVCAQFGVRTEQVMVELTESGLSKNLALTFEILGRLRLKGFGLSIDDFGTGYSSMEQLRRMPFTELKIDKGFVSGSVDDPRERAFFESSVALAKRLGMLTVAEGVETSEEFDLARTLECDLVQGFYFAKPMPGSDLGSWINSFGEL